VRGSDNVEIGYIERIGQDFIVVRPGTGSTGNVYYIPKTYIRDYDGSQLWIDAPSDVAATRFRTESKEPAREELRALAWEAPRIRRRSGTPAEASTATRRPAVLWAELKGKDVKTSDGKTLGEIKEISQNYVRIEKGTIKKENKFWLSKFIFDIYDGKSTRLVTNEEETMQYLKSQEPSAASEEYSRDFEGLRAARPSYARETIADYEEGIQYRNIRDLE
jgi:sporulation protein YlmC with PRC-barrel domain